MIIGVPAETFPGERRVALVPLVVPRLVKAGLKIVVQSCAGATAGFTDDGYRESGAEVVPNREEVFARADIVLQVRSFGANPVNGERDLPLFRAGQIIIGFAAPLDAPKFVAQVAERKVVSFALEFIPRIARAQAMDALSSMATIAGYKAVLLAASALGKMFPMLTTAAGTITPARLFVIGAGVAGLQAIATARRLGAVVEAYDIRPAAAQDVKSLGAKFVELSLESSAAKEDAAGYARDMGEEFYGRQQELMTGVIANQDVVITTAVVPGQKAPILLTPAMVHAMAPGSVIVDLAAERGGNCALTRPGETIIEREVTIIAPLNLPATVAYHASQMYAKNISTFALYILEKDRRELDLSDEITRQTLLTRGGEVMHTRIRKLLELPPREQAAA